MYIVIGFYYMRIKCFKELLTRYVAIIWRKRLISFCGEYWYN